MNWTDATTYSRNDAERKQTAWEIQTGNIRIYITNAHRYYPNEWVYSCHELKVDAKQLQLPSTATPEQAQKRAVAWVKARLQKMIDSLENI